MILTSLHEGGPKDADWHDELEETTKTLAAKPLAAYR